jgi:hypothetical protein
MNEVFSAAVVGGIVGTFFGGFSKFLWERWLPDWLTWRRTQRVQREHELSNLRAPAFAALADLRGRLRNIAQDQGGNAQFTKAIGEPDYYPYSTAFLIARAFAAQEIVRIRMAPYDYADLYRSLEGLIDAFSHGRQGFQFFRLEQREIGERMIVTTDPDTSTYMSLSAFMDQIEQPDRPRWMRTMCTRVESLLSDPVDELDRLEAIDRAMTSLMTLIDAKGKWKVVDRQPPIDAVKIRAALAQPA